MPASLEFYRALGVSVSEGQTGEPHVDTRLEDGTVLAWDTVSRSWQDAARCAHEVVNIVGSGGRSTSRTPGER